jgi:hypothetical protein
MYGYSPLTKLFKRASYKKVIRCIDSYNRILLSGKEQDGLGIFLSYYLFIDNRPVNYRSLTKGLPEF